MDLGGKSNFFPPFLFLFNVRRFDLYDFGMDGLIRLYFSLLFRALRVTGENGSI